MSLKYKITGFTLASAVLPLVITSSLIYNKVSDSLEGIVKRTVTTQASQEVLAVQEALKDAKYQLNTLGAMSIMQDINTVEGNRRIQHDLEEFAEKYPTFLELAVTNDTGIAIASTVPEMRYTSLESTWEYEAPRLGIVFDGPVVKSMRLGSPIATQSLPIYDERNPKEIIGTLIGSIDWSSIQSLLANRTLFGNAQDETGQLILKSLQDGTILYAPDGSTITADDLLLNESAGDFYKINHNEREFVVATADSMAIDGFRDPQWRLYVLLDSEKAYSMVNGTKRYFLLAATVSMLLITVLGLILARSIVMPVKTLVQGAERIASGDFEHPIETTRRDEIGQLARSFETMRDSIQTKQRELVHESEVAQQAAKAKGEFLANMSHEVRTPINGVLGMTELILNTELNPTQHRYASTISRSGQSLLSVINDILDFSKIEAGKLALHNSPFDLRDLVEDIVELVAESAHKKNVQLHLVMAPTAHTAFLGDASRLQQVLLNLLGNAIKFTDDGEVTLTVSVSASTQGHPSIGFQIKDTGVGISQEAQTRIFESFVQADGSTTRQFGGTGLGLAISSQLVELMGGKIRVESEIGEGSTFSFSALVEKLPEEHNLRWKDTACLNGACIAVIDDNSTNVEILKAHIQYWGAKAICAPNALTGLKLINKFSQTDQHPDIVLLDMNITDLNGLEVAKALKNNPLTRGSQLVIMSSVCNEPNVEAFKNHGIEVFLTKPVRQGELFRCLASITTGVAEQNTSESVVQSTKIESQLSGRVLLAEDNPVNQEFMTELLAIIGIDSVLAENGQIAVETLQQDSSFDLVLMDCQMPVLDGFEATATIRAHEQACGSERIPIIALTANAMEGDRERCLDAGMDEYLTKPIGSENLKAALTQFITSPKANCAPSQSQPGGTPVDTRPSSASQQATIQSPTDAGSSTKAVAAIEDFSHLPTLDEVVYQELCTMCEQASPGFYERLYKKYTQSAQSDLDSILNAIEQNDASAVSSSAHRLKSGTANWGGQRMAAYCQALEVTGKQGDLTPARSLYDCVRAEYTNLISALSVQDKAA